MKVRSGFVSNSSSSSFVVLLPEAFDPNTFDIATIGSDAREELLEWLGIDEDPQAEKEALKDAEKGIRKHLKEIKNGNQVWFEEDECSRMLEMIFDVSPYSDYVLTVIDGGSDEGNIIGVEREKVEKVLAKTA